jgi:hypothetical protein
VRLLHKVDPVVQKLPRLCAREENVPEKDRHLER